jgi:hypothetical protein
MSIPEIGTTSSSATESGPAGHPPDEEAIREFPDAMTRFIRSDTLHRRCEGSAHSQ